MLGHLQVIAGPDQGRAFPLEDGQTLVIGRGQNTATQLKDLQVSRVHCELQMAGGKFRLLDNGSAAGTLVNGKKINEQDVHPGDVIQIGTTQLKIHLAGAHDQGTVVVRPPDPGRTPEPVGAPANVTGQTVSHYEIGELVAKGQTGSVHKGRDTNDGKTVAIKVLAPEYIGDEEAMQRFIRAMKTVIALHHPNLVALYGAGKTGRICWCAMEYVEGESLTKVIQRIGTVGMLDWRYALTVAVQVARALEAAHEQHIIHRNVTPANILIRKADNEAKLGDLMLAKALEGTLAQQITRPGQLLGNLAYMAPERTSEEKTVDTRSDIYGLGATVYALLTGRPPFEGSSLVDTITKIRTAEPAKPKKFQLSIPDLFQDIVLKMLAKRPEDRYQTPSELLKDLERLAKFQGMKV
jgi:serine/threonine protein kinase